MVTAALAGRNLALTVEVGPDEDAIAPFIVRPLPGKLGAVVTERYLEIAALNGTRSPEEMPLLLAVALDGGRLEGDTLHVADSTPNRDRLNDELSLHEQESITLPALFWQTVLGMDGVNAFLREATPMAGALKALVLLVSTLGLSPARTSPSSVLETAIRMAPSTPTSTRPGGKKNGKPQRGDSFKKPRRD